VRVPRPLPTARADRARIGAVFHNLISNAIKYNDRPAKWVEVGHVEGDPPAFYVRDNGIGLAEADRERVFAMFTRLHARDAYGGGSGAGLGIARTIVERHGGTIRAESTPGAGTTFWFTLPPEG